VLLNKKKHILLSVVYCVWQVVKTLTINLNKPVYNKKPCIEHYKHQSYPDPSHFSNNATNRDEYANYLELKKIYQDFASLFGTTVVHRSLDTVYSVFSRQFL